MLMSSDSCDKAVPGLAAALKEEVRRSTTGPAGDDGTLLLGYRAADATIHHGSISAAGAGWSLPKRPLTTVLRI